MTPRAILIFIAPALWSCITTPSGPIYSDKVFTVATLDLFSQQEPPRSGKSWAGDWQFRRDRLDLVDATLRDVRPDIVLFQNAMRRSGSVSESDELILRSGALTRYEWKDLAIENFPESGEDRLMAIALAKPLQFKTIPSASRNSARFGVDGYMSYFATDADGSPVVIFNVSMPSKIDQSGLWYSLLEEKIRGVTAEMGSCPERAIIAGYLPFEQESRRFKDFLSGLGIKDTGLGFCQNADRCNTASPQNGIFLATRGDESASQVDRIMVHNQAIVYGAGANFNRTAETSEYKDTYGVTRIWAAQRFGWVARVRLPKCAGK